MSNNEQAATRWRHALMSNFGTPPVELVSGHGAVVVDADGCTLGIVSETDFRLALGQGFVHRFGHNGVDLLLCEILRKYRNWAKRGDNRHC